MPIKFNDYYEPFVGGASVVLGVYSNDTNTAEQDCKRKYIISDINDDLIDCYNVIKENVQELITELQTEKYKNEKDVFYENRTRYNIIKNMGNNVIEKAALFIYLNKCCFNGMHRQNKKGEYNVPFGKMKNPIICDSDTLLCMSKALSRIDIVHGNYKDKDNSTRIKEHDFVYLDPPYHGLFREYTKDVFGENSQKELKEYIDDLTRRNVFVMMSNSATEFIKELYIDYDIIEKTTKYSIGGKNANRGETQEVLITNYKLIATQ
jgi:DNA adenine methylase